MTQDQAEQVDAILSQFQATPASLIPVLQQVQSAFYYLPEPALRRIAARLEVSLADVFHVATFYNCFSLEPVGRHLVQVCLGTACHVRGAPRVLDRILRDLQLPEVGTTRDCEFTVRTVRCIGCCGLAPVLRVNQNTHPHMTQAKVRGMLNKYGRKKAGAGEAARETEDAEAHLG